MEYDYNLLMVQAKEASKKSYSPFSKFAVGACVLTGSGKIYSGCNIENSSFGMTICAERCAIFKAISEGEREFEHIVVCGGPSLESLEHCTPCGYCRQFMNEFVDQDFKIYLLEPDNTVSEYKIDDLLPHSFKL